MASSTAVDRMGFADDGDIEEGDITVSPTSPPSSAVPVIDNGAWDWLDASTKSNSKTVSINKSSPHKSANHKSSSVFTGDLSDDTGSSIGKEANPIKVHKMSKEYEFSDNDSGHDAESGAGPTPVSLVASSVVCFVIYFVFCIVFSSVVWDPLGSARDENINPPFGVPQGVGINLVGIAIGCAFFAWKGGCNAVIAGPDLLPVVFFAEAGASVMVTLMEMNKSLYPVDCGEDAAHRFLGGVAAAEGSDPCADVFHRALGGETSELHPDLYSKLVPTTLMAMMIGNAVTGLLFYGLGKMKNTASVIGFIPASVVAGFLTCIGYKVIKLAVLITTGFSFKEKYIRNLGIQYDHVNDPWLPLTIALIYGILLYGLKHRHVFAAEKLIMSFIIVPLIFFFIICAASGVSMDRLREENWFLTQAVDGEGCGMVDGDIVAGGGNCAFTRTNFWQTLQVAYGGLFSGGVAWAAVPRCIPIFIMGSCMTSLDSMLKLTSSEKALGVDLDYNHEMKLGGKATLVSALWAGSPAYGQTKFNVINLSIARTSDSPVPTLLLGALCLIVFLSGMAGPIINYMPRFLLGGLCVFAGVGFLYENLWEGRKNMNRVSFAIVWVIFLVNFIWEFFILQNLPTNIQPMVPGLLVVFILGIVLSTFEFMFAFMHKAKEPEIRGGDVCCSSAVRSEKHDTQLSVMSPWFQVFRVESFVFFGTANNLYQQLKAHLADQKASKPKAERTKYLLFDLTDVTGIDSSAKNVFFKVHRLLKTDGINLVWAMMNPKIVEKFAAWGLYDGAWQFDSLDLSLRFVEDKLLYRASRLSEKWMVNDTVRRIFERQVLANVFNISVRPDEKTFSSARLQPWSHRINLLAGEELCGDEDDKLYMLYAGEVQIQGRDGSKYSVFTGSFFNLDRLLVSIGALPSPPMTIGAVATVDSMVLVLPRNKFKEMQKSDGALAQKLLMTLIVQKESNRPGRVRPVARSRKTLAGDLDSSFLDNSINYPVNPNRSMAKRLLNGSDYKISLTDAQKESFCQIFDVICQPGEDEIPMDRFSAFVSMEAHALGSNIEHEQFMAIIDASGIDEDGDGSLSKDEFLSFLRGLFLADIPMKEMDTLRSTYDAAVAKAPHLPMDESRVLVLFAELGFDINSSSMGDVIGVIDADGDGDVDFSEFLTGIGMMKQFCILAKQLDVAFDDYKNRSTQMRSGAAVRFQDANVPQQGRLQRGASALFSSITGEKMSALPQDNSEEENGSNGVELDAGDLEAFLSVPREEAEEMVFLADQDEVEAKQGQNKDEVSANRTIDREEFQQLIRSWS